MSETAHKRVIGLLMRDALDYKAIVYLCAARSPGVVCEAILESVGEATPKRPEPAPAPAGERVRRLTEVEKEVVELLGKSRKLDAIKLVRAKRHILVEDAKKVVEELQAKYVPESVRGPTPQVSIAGAPPGVTMVARADK